VAFCQQEPIGPDMLYQPAVLEQAPLQTGQRLVAASFGQRQPPP